MDPINLISLLNGGQPFEQTAPVADDGQGILDAIERELQLLQLEKAANEIALRQALEKKKLVNAATVAAKTAGSPLRGAAKVAWEQAIIADEMSKPLQVTEDVVRRFREEEEATEQKVQEELIRHVALLRTLREKVGCLSLLLVLHSPSCMECMYIDPHRSSSEAHRLPALLTAGAGLAAQSTSRAWQPPQRSLSQRSSPSWTHSRLASLVWRRAC
jgi:hypothetical protein